MKNEDENRLKSPRSRAKQHSTACSSIRKKSNKNSFIKHRVAVLKFKSSEEQGRRKVLKTLEPSPSLRFSTLLSWRMRQLIPPWCLIDPAWDFRTPGAVEKRWTVKRSASTKRGWRTACYQLIWTVTNGFNDGWRVSTLNISARVQIRLFVSAAGSISNFPFRLPFSSLSLSLCYYLHTAIREHAFPIPLRALFITGRRVKIASHDVNESVVW